MLSTAHTNPPKLHTAERSAFNIKSAGRKYGIILGVLTSIYLIIINFAFGAGHEEGIGVPMGLRFAKHLLIVPVVWFAIANFAKNMPEGHAFKGGINLLLWTAIWSGVTIAVLNILLFAITGTSFEQFINEGETYLSAFLNSGLLIFETAVFVMIIGFAMLQYVKGKGSPED